MFFFILQLKDILRNTLDVHALLIQPAQQLKRKRHYDDNRYFTTTRHLRGASEWTHIVQESPVDTEFEEPLPSEVEVEPPVPTTNQESL